MTLSRRPDGSTYKRGEGVWHNGRVLLPLDLLPDAGRSMPETRPDSQAYDHMGKKYGCRCTVCLRPAAAKHQRRWRRDHGLLAMKDRY